MLRASYLARFAAIALATFCAVETAYAQVVRIRRGAGVVVRAPYVPSIRVGVGAWLPRIPLVRPYLFPRRAVIAAPPYGAEPPAPGYAGPYGEGPRYAPGATTASVDPRYAFPAPEQLASLDDGTLLNAVLHVTGRLDADLARFNTGAGWRKYLRLPADALPPPSAEGQVELGFASITTTLERLDSVAANPDYTMISRLPSFVASRAALSEVVVRFSPDAGANGTVDAVRAADPVSGHEELPTPPPSLAAPANSAADERSILAR